MALLRSLAVANRLLVGLLCWGAMVCTPGLAMAERIALVVGNARYEHIPSLATPAEDTRAVAEALRRLGFEVTLLSDVSTDMFNVVLDAFAKDAKGADAVLFYYAGHAFQDMGVNRLVPVEARLDRAEGLAAETWSMNDIAARIGGSGTTLIFLDACRTSPVPEALRRSDAGAQGLAEFDTPAGTFVSFSTRPGAVSFDQGTGVNSPFAQAFLDHVERPGQSVSDLMIKVRNEVEVATVGRQVPWDQSSLRAQFYFAGRDVAQDAPAGSEDPVVPEVDAAMLALMQDMVTDDTVELGPAPGAVLEDSPLVAAVDDIAPVAVDPAAVTNAPSVPASLPLAPVALPASAPSAPVVASAPVPLRLAAGSVERPAIQSISGGRAAKAETVTSVTRSTPQPRLAPIAAAEPAPRVAGTSVSGQEPSSPPAPVPGSDVITVIAAAPGLSGLEVPAPEALPRALQAELKRVGCYRMPVDGDWGNGSRTAVRRYFDAKNAVVTDADLEPTEALWRGLNAETGQVCEPPPPQPVVAKKAPQKAKPAAKAPKNAAVKQPAAPAPAPAKRKPKCTFVVIAIVCK